MLELTYSYNYKVSDVAYYRLDWTYFISNECEPIYPS